MSLLQAEAFSREEFDCKLDASDLGCPMPLLRANQMLNAMEAGQVMHVISTEKDSMANFIYLCESSGHELRKKRISGDKYHYLIRKAGVGLKTSQ
ncbi:MAG: sulfurtransferase TusA family protein [Gammaproteobacteria bacterium]|nr:sulfurtransferase TusA family protein [Gammaproteobacteria bacterium]